MIPQRISGARSRKTANLYIISATHTHPEPSRSAKPSRSSENSSDTARSRQPPGTHTSQPTQSAKPHNASLTASHKTSAEKAGRSLHPGPLPTWERGIHTAPLPPRPLAGGAGRERPRRYRLRFDDGTEMGKSNLRFRTVHPGVSPAVADPGGGAMSRRPLEMSGVRAPRTPGIRGFPACSRAVVELQQCRGILAEESHRRLRSGMPCFTQVWTGARARVPVLLHSCSCNPNSMEGL